MPVCLLFSCAPYVQVSTRVDGLGPKPVAPICNRRILKDFLLLCRGLSGELQAKKLPQCEDARNVCAGSFPACLPAWIGRHRFPSIARNGGRPYSFESCANSRLRPQCRLGMRLPEPGGYVSARCVTVLFADMAGAMVARRRFCPSGGGPEGEQEK
jgi:hypothetical protein